MPTFVIYMPPVIHGTPCVVRLCLSDICRVLQMLTTRKE